MSMTAAGAGPCRAVHHYRQSAALAVGPQVGNRAWPFSDHRFFIWPGRIGFRRVLRFRTAAQPSLAVWLSAAVAHAGLKRNDTAAVPARCGTSRSLGETTCDIDEFARPALARRRGRGYRAPRRLVCPHPGDARRLGANRSCIDPGFASSPAAAERRFAGRNRRLVRGSVPNNLVQPVRSLRRCARPSPARPIPPSARHVRRHGRRGSIASLKAASWWRRRMRPPRRGGDEPGRAGVPALAGPICLRRFAVGAHRASRTVWNGIGEAFAHFRERALPLVCEESTGPRRVIGAVPDGKRRPCALCRNAEHDRLDLDPHGRAFFHDRAIT